MGLSVGIGLDRPPPAGDNALLVDLLAFYNLDGNVDDSSGNGRDLTPIGALYTTGLIGQALAEGAGEDTTWITGVNWHDTPWSVSAWFKFVNFSPGAGGGKVLLRIEPNIILHVQAQGTDFDTADFEVFVGAEGDVFGGSLPLGWHHVVVTYSELTLEPIIYIDGAAVGGLPGDAITQSTATTRCFINADADEFTPIDLVGVWQRVLSTAEVAQLYNGGAGLDPT